MHRITNNDNGPRGFFVLDPNSGTEPLARERVVVPAGGYVDRELTKAQADKLGRWESLTVEDLGKASTQKAPAQAKAAAPAASASAAAAASTGNKAPAVIEVRKVAGNKSAVFKDGAQVGKPTTKAKAEAEAEKLTKAQADTTEA